MPQVKSKALGRPVFFGVLISFSLSLLSAHQVLLAAPDENKKPGLEPVASSSPASKSAMSEPAGKQSSAQSLPKPETAKTGTGKTSDGGAKSSAAANAEPEEEKEPLPFPVVSPDAVAQVSGVRLSSHKVFPSAIDIHGTASGVLMHARKDTRYDLLSTLSVWLEDGPLLISVKHPTEMALVATKFGDVCITAGGDALVERTDEGILKIVNLSLNNDTVFLNLHDKLLSNSPWGRLPRQNHTDRKGKKVKTYEHLESAAVSISPGYELVIGEQALELEQVKPPDSVGRRDFKTFEGAHYLVSEISIDNYTQLHDLIKNLNNLGDKATAVYNEIMKNAAQFKAKQGENGFEKNVPKPKVKRKPPPTKTPPKTTGKGSK